MERGGKRSATPLLICLKLDLTSETQTASKAPSPRRQRAETTQYRTASGSDRILNSTRRKIVNSTA